MSVEPRDATGSSIDAGEVMASVEQDEDGDRFIIADVSRDDAWLAAPTAEVPVVDAMR